MATARRLSDPPLEPPLEPQFEPQFEPPLGPPMAYWHARQKGYVTDVKLNVPKADGSGLDVILAHRVFLIPVSKYFQRAIIVDEKNGEYKPEVDVPDMTEKQVLWVLKFLYCQQLEAETMEDWLLLVYAASRFEIIYLRDSCRLHISRLLEQRPEDSFILLDHKNLLQTTNDDDILLQKARSLLEPNLPRFLGSTKSNDVSFEMMDELLTLYHPEVTEVNYFQALHSWALSMCTKKNVEPDHAAKRDMVGTIKRKIRFQGMTAQFVGKEVKASGLLTATELCDVLVFLSSPSADSPLPCDRISRFERRLFSNIDSHPRSDEISRPLISIKWYNSWAKYLDESTAENFPGPMETASLLKDDLKTVRDDLQSAEYKTITQEHFDTSKRERRKKIDMRESREKIKREMRESREKIKREMRESREKRKRGGCQDDLKTVRDDLQPAEYKTITQEHFDALLELYGESEQPIIVDDVVKNENNSVEMAASPYCEDLNLYLVGVIGTNLQSGKPEVWRVRKSGKYQANAAGARGGNCLPNKKMGGFGAIVNCILTLKRGQELFIVLGKPGQDDRYGGGGGGATIVTLANGELLLIVGGGGGAGRLTNGGVGLHGPHGSASVQFQGCAQSDGGSNGQPGGISTDSSVKDHAGPGAGWTGRAKHRMAGASKDGDWRGGDEGPTGGYGGGGGGWAAAGGGGGGYSGGGAGLWIRNVDSTGGGGGGSFANGEQVTGADGGNQQMFGFFKLTYLG